MTITAFWILVENESATSWDPKSGFSQILEDPQKRPGLQGWESVCWGVLGIPLLENRKGFLVSWFLVSLFQGLLVSWFLSFLVYYFLAVLVSWFLGFWFIGFVVSKFQRFVKLSLHVFDKYWSHIQEFQEFIRRISITFRCRLFEHCHFEDFPRWYL